MTVRKDARSDNRFDAGLFTPDPSPNSPLTMLTSQSMLELKLLLRNGEQLLLTMFIPITLLVGLTLLPLGAMGKEPVDQVVPAVMMVAIMSTAFTGQAIAVGFDRRYGALKRLGATPLPKWGIIGGKAVAVVLVVVLQSVLLGAIGALLGWRPGAGGLVLGAVIIALGTVTFATMGLLLGGTLRAEIVLALANILWFVMLGIGSLVVLSDDLPVALHTIARFVPSGALAEALGNAVSGSWDWFGVAVLAGWTVVCSWLAVRLFKFV
ncbi:ABC transporter permease [Rhodococcus sp. BP-252]|uniref:Multidrug ABC transporter permease n=1 Tax=Rhodococcoides kyotonense TaxID=398843 RepID=A0A177YGM9_9NOCA|nr:MULTISPECIES: ABC transporter permease [Rhodococcus]MBY6409995.1 ABC transporter permease [Rhodococcus sp. BP-320]MBY6414964.1 ABC transporter permease [Rhodococcus sp. BP-321]MBY6421333.1 ABC transporter permease [Rhodococcus sp. BP-324]MBY6425728.1 ABC transporter permease [Rhodococcus sp. BP-323]MBY6429860.1 ABC transporter permease [Rhodococcus sp. BP-322]